MGLKPLFFFLILLAIKTTAYPFSAIQDSSKHIPVTVVATPTFNIDSFSKPSSNSGTTKKTATKRSKNSAIVITSESAKPIQEPSAKLNVQDKLPEINISAREKEIEKELNQPSSSVDKAVPFHSHSPDYEKYREYYLLFTVLAMTGISIALLFERNT